MKTESEIIIGVEGGSTSSTAILLSREGKILSQVSGLHTNLVLLGTQKTTERLVKLLKDLLASYKLDENSRINYLGLSLSGLDNESAEKLAVKIMKDNWVGGIDHISACNDTVGSLRTAADAGIILISGTGSNCRLIHPDGHSDRVGGWGNAFGETGSAYGVVFDGMKRLVEHFEGLTISPYSTERYHAEVYRYFEINCLYDLIPKFYQEFDKTYIAKFTIDIVKLAEEGDKFCKMLIDNAGFSLGRHVAAAARKCEKEILESEEGLPIICVGSMWKSWHLLKESFLKGLRPVYKDLDVHIPRITLKRLTVTAAVGAAYIASEHANNGQALEHHYERNCEVFFKQDIPKLE